MYLNLDTLNRDQRNAVTSDNRFILVIAGAGTGKTKTLTSRIAYLLATGKAKNEDILALTFTNKAASEMNGRLTALIGRTHKHLQISTFHAYCLRFLKKNHRIAGLRSNFLLYDGSDQLETANAIADDLNIRDVGLFDAKTALAKISIAKNTGKTVRDFLSVKGNLRERLLGRFFDAYTQCLKNRNAVDFDDLILLTLNVLKNNRREVDESFGHILIDEYQDTNPVQYELLRNLADDRASIFAVGDDDQSIYAWRGADSQNIVNFRHDYPSSRIIALTQNYRSGNGILRLSNAVIDENKHRFKKKLTSAVSYDSVPVLYAAENDDDEMRTVIAGVETWRRSNGADWSSVAFIYRSNFHSRRIEETLRNAGIAYKLVGGVNFFSREEIRTALSYLKLIDNPDDDLNFHRAVKFPSRGIGDTTLKKLGDRALHLKSGLFHAIDYLDVSKSSVQALHSFKEIIQEAEGSFKNLPLFDAAKQFYDTIGFERALFRRSSSEEVGEKKVKNFRELLQSLYLYQRKQKKRPLSSFLDYTSLFQLNDDAENRRDKALLITAHMAKGQEFDCVCLCGLTDDSFPNPKAVIEGSLEEERRLFYVALTRTKKMLFLSYSKNRMRYGKQQRSGISRFLCNLPPGLVSTNFKSAGVSAEAKETRRLRDRENFFAKLKNTQ